MKPDANDVLALAGMALVGSGVAFIYWPAALIVTGMLLLAVGILPRLPPEAPVSWLERVLEPRADAPSDWSDFWYGDVGSTTEAGVDVGSDSALKTSSVFACVRVRSKCAALPMMLYRRTSDGGRERAVSHPLYEILHDRPNHWQTPKEFWGMMEMFRVLRGNAYAVIVPGRRGWVDELWPLHSDRVTVMLNDRGMLVYDYVDRLGHPQRKLEGEILHLRMPMSMDGYLGLSAIGYARETIGRQLAMERSNSRFHKNDATPRIALKHPGKFKDKDAYDRFRLSWNAVYGQGQPHGAAILEEGMDVVALGLKPEDAQFIASWECGITDICRWFDVHPRKAFAKSGDSNTYTNQEQAQIEHLTDTALPICSEIEASVARDLLLDSERLRYFPEYLLESLLRADTAARGAYYNLALDKWMTQDEIRGRENLPLLPGGDRMKRAAPASIPSSNPADQSPSDNQSDPATDNEGNPSSEVQP